MFYFSHILVLTTFHSDLHIIDTYLGSTELIASNHLDVIDGQVVEGGFCVKKNQGEIQSLIISKPLQLYTNLMIVHSSNRLSPSSRGLLDSSLLSIRGKGLLM